LACWHSRHCDRLRARRQRWPASVGAAALAVAAALFATVLMLASAAAFGAWPGLPAPLLVLFLIVWYVVAAHSVSRWLRREHCGARHRYALAAGAVLGNMAAGYLGYIGASQLDFWGKTVVDLAATGLLIVGWRKFASGERTWPATEAKGTSA
jgi:heme O synthase-like polyprenyltransferase